VKENSLYIFLNTFNNNSFLKKNNGVIGSARWCDWLSEGVGQRTNAHASNTSLLQQTLPIFTYKKQKRIFFQRSKLDAF
jgi:hypothetical protein